MPKPFSTEHDQAIALLYLRGWTTYQIAEKYEVSPTPIANALRREGIQLRRGGKQPAWEGTPEQRAIVAALYERGMSVQDIRNRTGCRTERILEVLHEDGAQMRPHGSDIRALTDEQARQAAELYTQGIPSTQIAERFGTSSRTIRNYLIRDGIPLRPSGVSAFWTEERKAEAAQRYLAGESQQAIASSWGVSQRGVSVALRSQGISTRKPQWRDGNPRWSGGRHIDGNGYAQVKPNAEDLDLVPMLSTGYVLEHRLVMARSLGRPLRPDETVHHINGNTQDNRLENLQLRNGRHGKGQRAVCLDCGSHNIGHEEL